jgi:hypothetical protein
LKKYQNPKKKNRNFLKYSRNTTSARASEASGPTRIRFCAKYKKNQHYDPETPKKPDPERDPNSKPLALRARGFQTLKLALRARFRA